jgi:uncharacterized membrane protein HdeD (DUF308 family)
MSTDNLPGESAVRHELQHLRSSWGWFLLLGILLVVCGTGAIVFPVVSSLAVMTVLAAILLVGGVVTIVGAFWAGRWSGVLVQLLVGIVYVALGFMISEKPIVTVVALTVFLAVTFMVLGAFRMLSALMIRFPQWGWALLNGVITFLLGLIIYRQVAGAPLVALWVIGLLVGIEMLFNGLTWIMLSFDIRRIPK